MNLAEQAAEVLDRLRARRPLVLCLTNDVAQNFTANVLLAAGAVPAMLRDGEECREMVSACTDALLINTGTLTRHQAEAMEQAVEAAVHQGIPWVLDPVAVGLLTLRTRLCRKLLASPPYLVRGNASEVLALGGFDAASRGPESTDEAAAALPAARQLLSLGCGAVLITGETDYAADDKHLVSCTNGHPLMTRVTAVGCAMGALSAACAAVADSPLSAAVASAAIYGLAGELAAARASHPGSFAVALLDALAAMTPADLCRCAKLM